MKFIISVFIFVAGFISANAQTFTNVTTFAGTGSPALVNGTLTTCQFNSPYGVCCDYATGDLYVADVWNHCIRKISGGVVTTLAGNGTQGDVNAQGPNARFYIPAGVAFFNGEVYVCDGGNNKVKKIDALGNVTTIGGTGSAGYQDGPTATAKFKNPTGLRVAPNGDVYVADYLNHCIRKISGGVVSTVAGMGNVAGDVLGTTSAARFDRPSDIVLDAAGNIYVADQLNNKVKVITTGGMVNLVAGSGTAASVNGSGAGASFNQPAYCDLDLGGNIILTECFGHKIRRVTTSGVATTIAGSGSSGFANGPVATARFNTPYGICIDNNGNIYVGDKANHRIRTLVNVNVNSLAAILTTSNVTCNGGADGTAIVTPSGGTGPYTYLWSPTGGTDSTAIGLSPGTYTCTITDSVGNVLQQTVTINQPAVVSASITSTSAGCIGANGSASVNATGGTGTLTYSWSPSGGTSASATGLAIGSYTCTITDANGCTGTISVSISNGPFPASTLVSQPGVLCYGGNTGSATVNVTNGTPPYTYAWAPTGGTTATGTGLTIGNYTCTITDALGCTATQTANITEPPQLTSTITSDTATCGNPNGSATVNAVGGVGPYTYLWSNSQTGSVANNLAGGTYSVTTTDANGCTTGASVVVAAVSAQVVSVQSVSNLFCFGGTNGSASVNVSGGASPFIYSWAPAGGNSAVATGLSAGTYTVTVIGNDGCIQTQLVTLTQPNLLSAADISTPENCSNTDGSASVFGVGGTPGYSYLWSNSSTNDTITNLASGNYTVTVTDANGCSASTTVAVGNVNSAIADAGVSVTISEGQSTILNGTGGVSYSWMPNSGLSCSACQDPVASPSVTTTYTLIVVDANGCTAVDSVTVFVETLCGEIFLPNAFSPNNDNRNDVFYVRGNCIATMEFRVFNRWGENVFSSTDITKGWDGTWRGNLCEPAVFTYVLNAVLLDGTEVVKSGNVSLVK